MQQEDLLCQPDYFVFKSLIELTIPLTSEQSLVMDGYLIDAMPKAKMGSKHKLNCAMLFPFCLSPIKVRRVATLVATWIPTGCRLHCSAKCNRLENVVCHIIRVCSLQQWCPAIKTDRGDGRQNAKNRNCLTNSPIPPDSYHTIFHLSFQFQVSRDGTDKFFQNEVSLVATASAPAMQRNGLGDKVQRLYFPSM